MKKLLSISFLVVFAAIFGFAKGKYTVNDIGKIVLQNGRLVSVDEYNKSSFEAVAVVYNISKDGSYFYGIGVNTIEAPLVTEDSYGYLGRFPGLEGLTDGSRAFDIIKAIDPDGAKDLANNYPALYFAMTYGKRFNVGKFTDGWYIPSFEEAGNEFKTVCDWKYLGKVIKSFEIFNEWPAYFWCSNSSMQKNGGYDYYLGYVYPFEKLPKNMKFSQNWKSSWVEGGWDEYYNSTKFNVIVMRKFY